MTPRSDFPIETSSLGDSPEGVKDGDEDPWTPNSDDESPIVKITVSEDDDVLIDTITVTDEKTSGVKKVTVVVKDKDGNIVVSLLSISRGKSYYKRLLNRTLLLALIQ